MARYITEITADGIVETLEFMGRKFVNTWVNDSTLEQDFYTQIRSTFPDIDNDILNSIDDLSASDFDEINEVMIELTEYEEDLDKTKED